MNTRFSHADNDSDFGPTVPGHRSGEGSGSILPYLAKSLKVNPNADALLLAHQSRAASIPRKKTSPQVKAPAPVPPPKPVKPAK
jgi:hypothetical protein